MNVFLNKPGSAPDTDNKAASTTEEANQQGNNGLIGANGETSKPIVADGTLSNDGKSDPESTIDNENFPGQDMTNLLSQDNAADAIAASNAPAGDSTGTGTGLSSFFDDKPKVTDEEMASFKMPGKVEATQEIKPVAAYKHREVNHFKVGDFEFRRHILEIYSEEAHRQFLRLFQGLSPRDQASIVEYDFEAAARVERPVQVSRGALSTGDIKDPKLIQ